MYLASEEEMLFIDEVFDRKGGMALMIYPGAK